MARERLDRALAPARTDPEGRPLVADVIAGIRNPGGKDIGLSDHEAAQVIITGALISCQKVHPGPS